MRSESQQQQNKARIKHLKGNPPSTKNPEELSRVLINVMRDAMQQRPRLKPGLGLTQQLFLGIYIQPKGRRTLQVSAERKRP
ncbi:hypothetical protein PsorP6_004793 [Peronosclerospora sorghi]|uniref:Uncharacterized protein n=1 Tax=Peronosclerospora sorghi TaxID=230839 RepID=A0ACC0VPH7_9STRA|nr:hypothetical protein PsorP6_004793 [Peronosclerospora sorghi]